MAHITDLGFTLLELGKAIDDGDVRAQTHPEFPELAIHNYTEDVQYRNRWNKITLACRGLAVNTITGEVVARPWEKFFNLGQMDNRIDSDAPVEVTDKLDGSLGILYRRPDGKHAVATRGSFASEQAIHASEVLYDKHPLTMSANSGINGDSLLSSFLNQWTFLFEIIYPTNRIVVDYEGLDDLVILGAVHKRYGYYEGPSAAAAMLIWHGPVAESFHAENFVSAISLPDRAGKEGYVVRSGSKMVKIKQSDYVELHRIVTNLSPKTIWEMLKRGETIGSICANIPDDFHKYVEDIANPIFKQVGEIKYNASVAFAEVRNSLVNPSRKDYAMAFRKKENPALLFMLLDGNSIDETVWKMVKPRGDVKTLAQDEG